MGFISKVFGISKLEEEFKKAISLQWCLGVDNIRNYSYTFEGNTLKVSDEPSLLVFDFDNLLLNVDGSLSLELFNGENFFVISKIENGEILSMNISKIDDTSTIFMKIKVNRNNLEFIGTLKNWHTTIPESNSWNFKIVHH